MGMEHVLVELTPDNLPRVLRDAGALHALLYGHSKEVNSLDLGSDGMPDELLDHVFPAERGSRGSTVARDHSARESASLDAAGRPALREALELLRLPQRALQDGAASSATPATSAPRDPAAPTPASGAVHRDEADQLWYDAFPGYQIRVEPPEEVAAFARRLRATAPPLDAGLAEWLEAIARFYDQAATRGSAVLYCIL